MQKKHASQSGLFNPRILLAIALCSFGASLGWLSFAATPPNGTLTDVSGPVTYTAGPFNVANPTPLIQVDSGPECNNPSQPCDDYALTVTLPAGYHAAHPNAAVKFTLSWGDTGSGQSDYDLYIYKTPRADCSPTDCTVTDGTQAANAQSASSNNPEVASFNPLADGSQTFTVVVVPYTPTGETVTVTIELLPGSTGCTNCSSFGGPDPTTPGVPRYQNFYAPSGSSAQSSPQGEFNIGFDPITKRIMTMNIGPIWRLTPGEVQIPAKAECCEALWEDKSNPATNTGLDPILFTDQKTGRTFASNFTGGANAIYGFTDAAAPFNDGDQWVPVGASPPNGGADHETLGSGPYPAALSALGTPVNQGEAVYYCSQDVVGPASCQRSDTLGASYGPGVLAYNGTTTACGGLHGHVHVAPDGTVWLPVNQCGGKQGGAVSTTAGATWTEFIVTGGGSSAVSQSNGADPSVALDSASTAYYCYVNNEANGTEGHVHVRVSKNGGQSWIRDFDVGASHGIVNAALTEAVGGSAGRAACGFVGTNVAGDYQSGSFIGKWYAFIATTYDEGRTWVTVNATPNDPVQSMIGIWQQGGSGQNGDRNLLDFNEITVDNKGRVLYGYSDGCTSGPCIAGTAPNDGNAYMRVARQFGGNSIFSQFDITEPTAPKPPCLSAPSPAPLPNSTRDSAASHLDWKMPDNGGSDITGYVILRGTTSGGETVLVANTGDAKTTYNDTTALSSVPHYFYVVKAINAQGIGVQSNEIDLTIGVIPPLEELCKVPGLTKLTDPQGDTSAALGIVNTQAPPGADLKSFQIAQPYQTDGIPRLVFTIGTWDNGQSPQPTGSAWYVAMKIINGATTRYEGVHMAWNPTSPTTPTFESYVPGANTSGGVDGRFVTPGTQKPAEASSSYASPFNKVVIVVKASDLGLSPGDTILGFLSAVSQSTDPGATVGAGATALYDQMPDSLSFTAAYTVVPNNTCFPLLSVVSRKTHGTAGDFDINLPLAGSTGLESRGTGGANNAYTLVYTFDRNLVTGAPATTATVSHGTGGGTGAVSSQMIGPNPNQYTVNLINVSSAQHLLVTLDHVHDAAGADLLNMIGRMDVLVGDVNASARVDSGDVSLVRQQTLQTITNSNFREDINASGRIDSGDVSIARQQTLTSLP